MGNGVSDELLSELERLSALGAERPWHASVEGRDHLSGDSFIMIGEGEHRQEDMYVFRDSRLASAVDLDLIVASRNHLPDLIDEIRRLREGAS